MPDTVHRITLTDEQVADVLNRIDNAPTPQDALADALKTTFAFLLEPEGLTWDDFGPDHRLDGKGYAIPDHQWCAIGDKLTEYGRRDPVGAVNLLLDWMNLGPSGFKAVE